MLKCETIKNSRYWDIETSFLADKSGSSDTPGFPDLAGRAVSELIGELLKIDQDRKNYLSIHLDEYAAAENGQFAWLPFAFTYYALRLVYNMKVILASLKYDNPIEYAIGTETTKHLLDMAEFLREYYIDSSYTGRLLYINRNLNVPQYIRTARGYDTVFNNDERQTGTERERNGMLLFDHLPVIRPGIKSTAVTAFFHPGETLTFQRLKDCPEMTAGTTSLQTGTYCPYTGTITGEQDCLLCRDYAGRKNERIILCKAGN